MGGLKLTEFDIGLGLKHQIVLIGYVHYMNTCLQEINTPICLHQSTNI